MLFRDGRAAYTVLLSLGIGLHAMDVFVIASIMPTVVADIGGASLYSWPTMLYMVASIVGAASAGPLRRAYGPRHAYALGGTMFLIGSAGCGASPIMFLLLAARTVQGYGGGLVLAQSMGLVGELYTAELRPRVLALVSGVWAVAALLGPLVGGLFAELGWWRGAFWIGVPVIVAFTGAAWRTLPDIGVIGNSDRYPIRRVALLAAGVLSAGLSGNVPSPIGQALLLALAVAMTVQTFVRDAQATNRLFPPRALSPNTTVGASNWILLLFSVTHTAIGMFLPLALQVLHGVGPLAAGYANAALAVSWTVASFVTAGWRGPAEAAAVVGGPVLAVASLILLTADLSGAPVLLSCLFTGIIGFGIGAANLHLVAFIMCSADKGFEGLTASSIPTFRALGICFGAAAAGLIANTAGLGDGIADATVGPAVLWVYAATIAAPTAALLLALRVIKLRQATTPA